MSKILIRSKRPQYITARLPEVQAAYDGLTVDTHLMLIPKRHVGTFSDFTEQEVKDYWYAYTQLSDEGFNTMTRATSNLRRSAPTHLHTHLLSYRS